MHEHRDCVQYSEYPPMYTVVWMLACVASLQEQHLLLVYLLLHVSTAEGYLSQLTNQPPGHLLLDSVVKRERRKNYLLSHGYSDLT